MLAPLVPLAVICFGVRYAVGRERLRSPDHLHTLYQHTNRALFDGKLQDVVLEVENLSDQNAEDATYRMNNRFALVLDPKWNTSEDEPLQTMRHESCHVATWGEEPDPHGSHFQDCMKRFERDK